MYDQKPVPEERTKLGKILNALERFFTSIIGVFNGGHG